MEPQLLLLDEPGSGLNESERKRLMLIIREVQARGLTVLLVSHEMDLVMSLSDHIVVLHYGEVISTGDSQTVQTDTKVIRAYLGEESKSVARRSG
jgi:branched-chain amino acid transport system ATP-binding protein